MGIGRPFLYAFSTYGEEGVDKALQILRVCGRLAGERYALIQPLQDEFEMNMRLLGAPKLKDVTREMVDASSLKQHIVAVPDDRLFHLNCK